MKFLQTLKARLWAILVLAAFVVAVFAPVGKAEAAWSSGNYSSTSWNSQFTQNVSWNSGPRQ